MNTTEDKLVTAMSGLVGIQQFLVGLPDRKTAGVQILENKNFQNFCGNKTDMFRLELKTAITGTGTAGDPLVPGMKPPIDAGVRRALTVRDLLRSFPTENGAIEMPVVSSKTINAGPQAAGSPQLRENVTMPESAYTFENSFVPVQTLGHFVPVSKQIFEDAGTLDAFIQGELAFGLQLGVEDQLLNGDASPGHLTGLLAGATAWSNESPNITNEVDVVRSAIKQIQTADFIPTAVLLNPSDWFDIETRKAGSSDDIYAAGSAKSSGTRLWDLPVVVSNSIASGSFLVGDFARAGALFVRQGATVEVARHDGTNFTTNMLTIRATERLAWVTTNPLAMVTGSL